MTSRLSIQEIRSLPKVDLHRHLDCSMRWSTLLEIATTLKIDFPQDPLKQRQHFLVTDPMVNLEAVLSKFLVAQKVLASEEILERLAYEVCEDAFNDGVRLLELRYAPTFISDGHPNLSFEKILLAFLRGLERAEKNMAISTGLICILQRGLPLDRMQKVTDFAIENKSNFLALDLADNEDDFDLPQWAPLFIKAKNAGLHITIHSGEAPHPQAGQRVRDSINVLGAERIGHGIQVIHHPDVMKFLIEKNIPLEICPYSNYLTQAFKTHRDHPLRKLYDNGVIVTLNSDDPGIFASTLSDDFLIAQDHHGFTANDFEKCTRAAYNHSFISSAKKQKAFPQYK